MSSSSLLWLIIYRNRLPNHFDDLSYWSDVFLWREHHFKCIVKAFDGSTHHGDQVCHCWFDNVAVTVFIQSNQSLLAVHNLASGITQFASIARTDFWYWSASKHSLQESTNGTGMALHLHEMSSTTHERAHFTWQCLSKREREREGAQWKGEWLLLTCLCLSESADHILGNMSTHTMWASLSVVMTELRESCHKLPSLVCNKERVEELLFPNLTWMFLHSLRKTLSLLATFSNALTPPPSPESPSIPSINSYSNKKKHTRTNWDNAEKMWLQDMLYLRRLWGNGWWFCDVRS